MALYETKYNNFIGEAKKLEDIDLPRIGHMIGVGEDAIHAVLDVESRGSGFDRRGRPKILFERHWFHRLLEDKPAKLERAKREGLAVNRWSRATYNQDQYDLLRRAMAIDESAALQSASWGLGQVMGFNYKIAGYSSVTAFIHAMIEDEDNHLEAMINFIKNKRLDDELRELEAATTRAERVQAAADFASVYNGPGYRKNKYHTRIADRFEWWQGKPDTPWSPDDALLEEEAAQKEIEREEFNDMYLSDQAQRQQNAKPKSATGDVVDTETEELVDPTKDAPRRGFLKFLVLVALAGAGYVVYRNQGE